MCVSSIPGCRRPQGQTEAEECMYILREHMAIVGGCGSYICQYHCLSYDRTDLILGVTSTRSPGCGALEIHMCTTHMCIARRRARTSRVSRLHYYASEDSWAGAQNNSRAHVPCIHAMCRRGRFPGTPAGRPADQPDSADARAFHSVGETAKSSILAHPSKKNLKTRLFK